MENKKTFAPFDLKQFEADTNITSLDMLPELVAFSIFWHSMEYGNDPENAAKESKGYMLTLPFVFKICDRLRKEGRWPEERNLENSGILSAIMMVKAAKLTPVEVDRLRTAITDNFASLKIF